MHGAQAAAAAANLTLGRGAGGARGARMQSRCRSSPGCRCEARRAINLAAIAYAEVLCLRVAVAQDAARGAGARGDRRSARPADDYGAPKECVLLMGQIARAQRLIAERDGLGEGDPRARRAVAARWRATAAPPTAPRSPIRSRLAKATSWSGAARRGRQALPNVLAEDTWDLFRVLLR